MYNQPTYERSRDRAVQDVVQEYLQAETRVTKPDLTVIQTVKGADIDYIWRRGRETVHVGELKRRNVNHDHWPEYMISASKIRAIQRYAPLGWVLVLFRDGLFRIPVKRDMPLMLRMGGRTTQARDSWEAGGEQCAFFAPSEMRKFYTWTPAWQKRISEALTRTKE